MRSFSLLLLIISLAGPVAVSQDAPASKAGLHPKAVTISGTVSNDGKTLVSEHDDTWTISNAEVMKGQEGRQVTVKCRPDPAKGSIHVFFFRPVETRYIANNGDSAFRR